MHKSEPQYQRKFSLLALIIAGESIFFLPFVIARIFRPTLLQVFEITNTELGVFFSIYGIIAMVSYFLGGPLADRFSSRKLIFTAMCLTSFGGLVMWQYPVKQTLYFLYAFWGITTIFLFWAALIKATRVWGGSIYQGRAFGWLEGGRGASAAILGTLTLLVFADQGNTVVELSSISAQRIAAFRNVILFTSIFTFLSGVLVWFLVPDNLGETNAEEVKINQIAALLKIPRIWLIAIIILCAYVGYKITDYFSLYANEVLGLNEVAAASIGAGALWIRAFAAVLAGFAADKLKSSKIITICFVLAFLASVLLSAGLLETTFALIMLNFVVLLIGIYGIRALYFALISEAAIPMVFTGTAVGIISILGYTPDIFLSPWMGHILDSNPGVEGHRQVFLVLASFLFVGLMASVLFGRSKGLSSKVS